MKLRIILYFVLASMSLVAQKDEFHTYLRFGTYDRSMNFISMEDSTALIFTVKNYNENVASNFESLLTKVDYCGEILEISTVEVIGFYNLVLIDGLKKDDIYTVVGTAINEADHLPYFVVVSANLELTHFEVIDSKKIKYPVITSISVYSSKDTESKINNLLITTSLDINTDKEVVFISYSDGGKILKLKTINLTDKLVYDYYYNQEEKLHFIFSGSILTIFDRDGEITHSYDVYVILNDIKYYNFEYKILYADNKNITLLGRWGSQRKLYTYTIFLNGDDFVPGVYNQNIFTDKRFYVPRKKISREGKIIISSSTDLLDTNNETSNEVFFWELDQDGNISKTYKFTDENKINLEITDIDLKGNLLGLGYEYANDRNFFVILGENSSFLSNVGNVENGWKDLLVYPNPACDEILIKSETNLTSVKIFDILGREVFCSMNLQPYAISIDIRNLVAGSYHLLLSDGSLSTHKKFVKL